VQQLRSLIELEQAADRFGGDQLGCDRVEFVDFNQIRIPIKAIPPLMPANANDRGRIENDHAGKALAGFVREPETRHAPNLGRLGALAGYPGTRFRPGSLAAAVAISG
jgi:hypothetical protein